MNSKLLLYNTKIILYIPFFFPIIIAYLFSNTAKKLINEDIDEMNRFSQ